MDIDYLANHKAFIPEVARMLYGHWANLFEAAGTTESGLTALLEERAVTDKLPIALVALVGRELAGTGSIKLFEPGTKASLSPWLAGIYVKESHRGSGIGESIVQALEAKAQQLGVETLYLSVGSAEAFYRRLSWTVLERANWYGIKEVALMAKHIQTGKV